MQHFKRTKLFIYIVVVTIILEAISLFYSWDFYLNHYPERPVVAQAWECGYKDLAAFVKSNYNKYNTFYITQKNGEPYIFMLFYLQYPPKKYQEQASLSAPDQFGFGQVEKFDKFNFTFPPKHINDAKSVFVGYPDDFLQVPQIDKRKLKKITIDGQDIFWIYTND